MGMENDVNFEAMAESEVKEEPKKESKYGIGTIINSREDWNEFVDLLNSLMPEDEESIKPESLHFSDDEVFPTFVALNAFTLDELKDFHDKGELVVGEWANVETLIKIADAGYLLSFGLV